MQIFNPTQLMRVLKKRTVLLKELLFIKNAPVMTMYPSTKPCHEKKLRRRNAIDVCCTDKSSIDWYHFSDSAAGDDRRKEQIHRHRHTLNSTKYSSLHRRSAHDVITAQEENRRKQQEFVCERSCRRQSYPAQKASRRGAMLTGIFDEMMGRRQHFCRSRSDNPMILNHHDELIAGDESSYPIEEEGNHLYNHDLNPDQISLLSSFTTLPGGAAGGDQDEDFRIQFKQSFMNKGSRRNLFQDNHRNTRTFKTKREPSNEFICQVRREFQKQHNISPSNSFKGIMTASRRGALEYK